jgi:hypothetical protein
VGLTLAYPIRKRHMIRAGYSAGVVTEVGSDFSIFSLAYIYAWR